MSLFNRAIRPSPSLSDAAVERYLAALRHEIDPDPLFRRRLRTDAVNRFVAAREGIGQPPWRRAVGGQMGRLGRACLYASFTLGVTGTAVLAAAENALPGEALYPLKQRIEELRYELVPAHLHGELAGYALGMRIEELARLTEAGRLDLALALAPAIEAEYARLESLGASVGPFRAARIERHLLVLDALLQRLPDPAREKVEGAFDNPAGSGPDPGGSANGGGANPIGGRGPMSGPREEPAGGPDRTPRPEATSAPNRTPGPERSKEPAPPVESPMPEVESED